MVTINGLIQGQLAGGRWLDGNVLGDDSFEQSFRIESQAPGQVSVTPTGPFFERGSDTPWQFLATAMRCFDHPAETSWMLDHVPDLPKLPDNAVS
jgi:hypothetical protein